MRTQSATATITDAVTAAAGVFAPGHLGELTQYLPQHPIKGRAVNTTMRAGPRTLSKTTPNSQFGKDRQAALPTARGAPIRRLGVRYSQSLPLRSAVDRPPGERAKPRTNVDRLQATPSYARRLSSLVKCPLSDTEPRLATPGT